MDIKSNSLREVLSRAFGLNLAPDNLIEAKSGTDESAETGNLKIVDDELKQRAGRRLLAEEISKQKNIEGVVQRTDKLLESEPEISKSTEETDQGWVDECLDGAGKAYNDDLKDYWAKLLAGEIKHPGFYSLRAIDFMKKLSKKDAERIREMCKYVMYNVDKSDAIILRYKESPFLYSDLSFLMELRLIDSSNFIVKQYRFKNEDGGIDLFVHGDVGLVLNVKSKEYDLPIYSFTQLGKEMLTIIDDQEADIDYLREFARITTGKRNKLEISGGHMEVIGDTLNIKKDEYGFTYPEEIREKSNDAK